MCLPPPQAALAACEILHAMLEQRKSTAESAGGEGPQLLLRDSVELRLKIKVLPRAPQSPREVRAPSCCFRVRIKVLASGRT